MSGRLHENDFAAVVATNVKAATYSLVVLLSIVSS